MTLPMVEKVKAGQRFYATVRGGPHSRTLDGKEVAGRKIGPFTATRESTSLGVQTGFRFLSKSDFCIEI